MQIEQTALPGVVILTPARHGDHRGFFSESWNKARMEAAGITTEFVQDNHSLSEATGTLRGLHFQAPPWGQAKLVRCGRGRLLDVAVDVRRGSPSYGQSVAVELSFESGKQLMIPEGFLHGFVTLEPMTEIIYKCSNYYNGAADGSVAWDSCGVDWGVTDPVLSAKDTGATPLSEFDTPFVWEG